MSGFRGLDQVGNKARVWFQPAEYMEPVYADLDLDDVNDLYDQLAGFMDAWHASEQNDLAEPILPEDNYSEVPQIAAVVLR